MSEISVLLPDGSERRVADGTTGLELASSISRNLGKAAVAIEVDGRESDLSTSLHDGCRVRIVTSDSD
ncbi:MAG: threonyl-tRNA synthetase, partial [Actinomycetota bacterium]